MTNSLFDIPEPDLSELDMPPRMPLESKEKYKERTGLEYVNPDEGKPRKAKTYYTKPKKEETETMLAQLDPIQVRAYGKRMLAFLQSKELVVKFLSENLDIDSYTAEHEVEMMLGEIRADFTQYITSSAEQNIMTLREMEKLALERHDTRSATEIVRTLDQLTNRYLEDHDMLPEKKKKSDDKEVEIIFS